MPIVAPPPSPSFSELPLAEQFSVYLEKVAKEADKESFSALFDYFAPRLKSTLRRQGLSSEQAEEIVQDTMLTIWRQAGSFNPQKASASTWIYTIARHRRIDLLRKTNRPEISDEDPNLVVDPTQSAEDKLIDSAASHRLFEALGELPEDQAELMHLAFYENQTHGAIAKIKNLPLGTVKSRLRLALEKMRRILKEEKV